MNQTTINQSKDAPLDQNNSNLEMTVVELYGNEFQEIQEFQEDWHLDFKTKQFH